MRLKWFMLIVILFVPLVLFAQDDINDLERTYELFVPEGELDAPLPVVLVLHGASGNGARTQGWLGFDEIAQSAGFIIVYPDGLGGQWDFGAGLATTRGRVAVDDVGFILNIIEELKADYTIDTENIFVTGMSDGAAMTYYLGCQLPKTFRAIAGVASTIPVFSLQDCETAAPMSAMFFHGTADTIVPWDGIKNRSGQVVYLSMIDSVTWWAAHNGCDTSAEATRSEPIDDSDPDDGSHVNHVYLPDCNNGTEIHLYGIIGGGHTWANHPFNVDMELGNLNRDIDATQIIMDWFIELANHPSDETQED